jgi:hypothetical protein
MSDEEGPAAPGRIPDVVDRHVARTCFVIGPIGNRHAADSSEERLRYEEALQVFEEIIQPACARHDLEPVRADGLARAGEITEQVFRRLHDDDVVIADLTEANPNVMYELGLRHTRDALTLQVGEFGRLPFDVNVIRTVQFSRSRYGMIQARDELASLLQAGLSGEYDAVSATRIWNQVAADEVAERLPEEGDDEATREEDDAPGLIDQLAFAEEHQERVGELAEEIAACIESLGRLAEETTEKMEQSDARGGGMRERLAITIGYASGMDEIATRLDRLVDEYVESMAAVSGGNLALIAVLEEDPFQLEQNPEALEFGITLRGSARITRDSLASLAGQAISETSRHARVMREPAARIRRAFDKFSAATAVVDEWDRRLRASVFPCRPRKSSAKKQALRQLPSSGSLRAFRRVRCPRTGTLKRLGTSVRLVPKPDGIACKRPVSATRVDTSRFSRYVAFSLSSGSNGPNPRPACHAEGRGFESHHPLLKPAEIGGFCFGNRQHESQMSPKDLTPNCG